jgi:hypothetical protein
VRPLRREEIVAREDYEALRPRYRDAVIAHKRDRRVALGEKATLVFEDRETLRFQVQEMLWIEGIEDPEKIQHELDVYNELMPGERELSATLFIEITELAEIRPELNRLIGLDEHVSLRIGAGPGEEVIRARFDPRQSEDDRLSAVQYIRFPLDAGLARRFADAATAGRLRCDHPNYRREAELPPAVRARLARDLLQEPEALLRPPAKGAADLVLFEDGRVRALRPARPRGPGHVVVEAISGPPSLLEAEPELLSALMHAVLRVAREVVREHGACRVAADLGPGEGLRWHVLPRRPSS